MSRPSGEFQYCPLCPVPVITHARNLCNAHYARRQRHGDPAAGQPLRHRVPPPPCGVVDCDMPFFARSLCLAHYRVWWRVTTGRTIRPTYDNVEALQRIAKAPPRHGVYPSLLYQEDAEESLDP